MKLENKASAYKYLFLISTVCGALGVYCLYKEFSKILSFTLIGVWAAFGLFVRILIMRDKKILKEKKDGTV
ncbi:MAG: hypothetical protein LBO62_06240 [Endomicrobium sp.]|jgi:hypothetical protein|nr:hypothetical protein [Endomicrobium sp.]